jgi:hypothetical protein
MENIMNHNLISAVFDSRAEAERAVSELRAAGADDKAISIVARHDGEVTRTDGGGERSADETGGFFKSVVGGAGIGTILGIAALAIPGVGPLAAAGAIASTAIPGAAATGALLGAATGGLAKILTDHGVSDEDAAYYEERIGGGGVFVSVDGEEAGIGPQAAGDILYRNGGHSASRARMAASV